MRALLVLVLLVISHNIMGQSKYMNIKNKKLTPVTIDTVSEKIFVYVKPFARIYFKVDQIMNHIDSLQKLNKAAELQALKDTLMTVKQKLEIVDWVYSYDDQEGIQTISRKNISKKDLEINKAFESIGADLILGGEFMVYSGTMERVVTRRLKVVRAKGVFDVQYLSFIFPDRSMFYWIPLSTQQ